jgi:hypothetical protein
MRDRLTLIHVRSSTCGNRSLTSVSSSLIGRIVENVYTMHS